MRKNNSIKTLLINWLAIYPLITMVLYLLEPILFNVILPVKTLILTVLVVPTMFFITIPLSRAIFKSMAEL
ncbi:hypothetical protein DKG77_03415 [Flagellimonas aquimarina]|uniref:Uncharacterized protein n=1 Tax=Flagellimonas aquimarina TaxID=2201895 RepID=A0A316L0A6_9FLAO|nr:hypothetical protein DKG77_03415 [Allomuricauda koreensis]